MKPKKSEREESQRQLFKTPLSQFLKMSHPLIKLSGQIDWKYFEEKFGTQFNERGRPALPTRLVVALTYLKYTYNLSDEVMMEEFVENGYWQYFCGFEYFQHEFPCDSSSLTRWRKRLGEEGCKKLLTETLRIAHKTKQLKLSHIREVVVDTTVQEKNITHPTDAKLLQRARVALVKAARERGIRLRQSYKRVGKWLSLKQSKYAHAKQFKRARRATRKLRTILGRVIRDIERKCEKIDDELNKLLTLSKRLYRQKPSSKNKLYSLHEPAVDCISKGKAHKPYEFGCKTSIVKTARSNWVLGVKSFHGNPYDGSTLKESIKDVEDEIGGRIGAIFVDKGYRGKKYWPKGKMVLVSGRKRLKPVLKKLLKRRSAIEPVIGHMKREHRFSRNLLKGKQGDHVNAILAGAAFNMRKLIRRLGDFFVQIFQLIKFSIDKKYLLNFSKI